MAPVIAGEADFATGSRFIDPSLEPEMPRMKRWVYDSGIQVPLLVRYPDRHQGGTTNENTMCWSM